MWIVLPLAAGAIHNYPQESDDASQTSQQKWLRVLPRNLFCAVSTKTRLFSLEISVEIVFAKIVLGVFGFDDGIDHLTTLLNEVL